MLFENIVDGKHSSEVGMVFYTMHGSLPRYPATSPTVANAFVDGEKWHGMLLWMLRLNPSIHLARKDLENKWCPAGHLEGEWEDAWDAWLENQALHAEAICSAARQLIYTRQLSDPTPEVLYFLSLRYRATLKHLRSIFVWRKEKPLSLVPFPALTSMELAEWFLTEWGDQFAIDLVFPEEPVCLCCSSPDRE